MISETTLMDCENVPPEMASRFDRPWHFLGEVKTKRPWLQATCNRCDDRPSLFASPPSRLGDETYQIVELKGYLFITDDRLEVVVYFGVCPGCDAVYWARQGPPFRRARCLVTA